VNSTRLVQLCVQHWQALAVCEGGVGWCCELRVRRSVSNFKLAVREFNTQKEAIGVIGALVRNTTLPTLCQCRSTHPLNLHFRSRWTTSSHRNGLRRSFRVGFRVVAPSTVRCHPQTRLHLYYCCTSSSRLPNTPGSTSPGIFRILMSCTKY
jgi:hypothetical protein